MKIKQLYKWQLKNMYLPFGIYYSIMLIVYIIAAVVAGISSATATSVRGFNVTNTPIFLIIFSIVMFTISFKFTLACGISRKTMMITQGFFTLTVAAFSAFADVLLTFVTGAIMRACTNGMVTMEIGSSNSVENLKQFGDSFISLFGVYLLVCVLFYFLSALHNRMSKSTQLIVYIGVPVLVFAVSGIIGAFASVEFIMSIGEVLEGILKFITSNMWNQLLVMLTATLVFSGLSVLCIRRAPCKIA